MIIREARNLPAAFAQAYIRAIPDQLADLANDRFACLEERTGEAAERSLEEETRLSVRGHDRAHLRQCLEAARADHRDLVPLGVGDDQEGLYAAASVERDLPALDLQQLG